MEIRQVTKKEYDSVISGYHAFSSGAFNELNSDKCNEIHYLLFFEGKYRTGIIGGSVNGAFYSPFSAPYGGFSSVGSGLKISYIEEAVRLLQDYLYGIGNNKIVLILPPSDLHFSFVSKQINVLFREGYSLRKIDLNYSLDLKRIGDSYIDILWPTARNKLKIVTGNNLTFGICHTEADKKAAYDVIQINRSSKGYPLKMSWNDVVETTKIIKSDSFIIRDDSQPIASAIIFYITPDIVQIIYWGDIPDHTYPGVMNLFARKVFDFYKDKGLNTIDIGPSTEDSIPNYGLGEFKESIGCSVGMKYTWEKSLG